VFLFYLVGAIVGHHDGITQVIEVMESSSRSMADCSHLIISYLNGSVISFWRSFHSDEMIAQRW
jgi:hypothetical protein